MNEQERAELELLKQRHRQLEGEMAELLARLIRLEQRAATTAHAPEAPAQLPKVPVAAKAPEQLHTRIHLEVPKPTLSNAAAPPVIAPGQVPPPPPAPRLQPASQLRLQKPVAPQQPVGAEALQGVEPPVAPPMGPGIPQPTVPVQTATHPGFQPARPAVPLPEKSFEMRLGTYWLVRIGIVMVLTGLVFFGNLAYQKIITQLGPGGKVTLLYIASFALIAAGTWWQRQAVKESLRNYAQVLLSGGLAAVYFTTYAAHHLPQLRVIQSATLDGFLLLLWAGVIAWLADRKKSEVMGVFAVGLAYYSSIMTRVGYFTLFSNLVLAAAALFFLVRNRWAGLSLVSLLATYGGYGFWRFFDGQAWHWAVPEQGLWTGSYFLICYWAIFTAAVFLSRSSAIVGENRAGYLTLNNAAFFVMFLLTMLQVREGAFWRFFLLYGSVLLVLAVVAARALRAEPLAANSYLTQGLLLFTVGLITKFSGLNLALLLGAESVILLTFGQRRSNIVLLTGAFLAGALSVGWGMDGMEQFDRQDLLVGIGLGAIMLVNTFLVHRDRREDHSPMRGRVAYFALLALAIWWVATYDNVTAPQLPVVLAIEALVLTMSIYLLRIREISLLSQLYVLIAFAFWFFNLADTGQLPQWWSQALLLGLILVLSHWWQRQRVLDAGSDVAMGMQGVYAAVIVGFLYIWLDHWFAAPRWMAMTGLLAVVLTVYGVQTRFWFLAAFGQVFVVATAALLGMHLAEDKPGWHLALAPIVAIGFLAYSTRGWFLFHEEVKPRVRDTVLQFAALYRWAALAMSILWICRYIPEPNRVWLLGAIGLWIFLVAGLREAQESVIASAMFSIAGLVLFWSVLLDKPQIRWANLLLLVCIFAQQRLARRLPERYSLDSAAHNGFILAVGLSFWLFLSTWVLQKASGFYLTASWSVLALVLFTFGVVFRERMYRWLGLGILACSLGRVIIFDVWKLETLYRILSFMALGIVLLVLGFIYNKYQEKIRQWL